MAPIINKAFAKLMMEIDYPVRSWEDGSIDEYLDYTINLLDLLNSISSCISHMKEIKKHDHSIMELKAGGGDYVDRNKNEKEWIFNEAMMVLRSTGFWVCKVVLSGLKSEVDPIMEIKGNMDSSLMALDSVFRKKFMDEGGFVKEVEGMNESVRLIISSGIDDSDGGMELKRRLEVVGNGLGGLKEEEGVFRSVMATRNEVLETLKRKNN